MLFIERLVEKKGVVVGRSRETGGGTSSFRVREYASDVNSTGGRGGEERWSLTAAIAYSSRDAGGV